MALDIPEGFAQVGVQMRRSGDPDPWYVTYGVNHTAFSEDWPLVANAVGVYFVTPMINFLPVDTTFSGVQLRIGMPGLEPPLTLFFPFSAPGGGGGTTLPQNCAVLITKITSRSGRTGKGRLFWPTILEADVNGLGIIEPTARNAYQAAMDDVWEAHSEGIDPTPNLPMYLLHNEGVPGGSTPTLIDSLQVDPIISTQRRRLR